MRESDEGTINVLVIGAGPAGIASAYYLKQAGIAYRVVDSADVIASTWASLYPSLKLNTTRFYSHMPHKRFPLSFGIFPTGRQYHRYLVDFVREHDLDADIRLGVSVERVTPEDGGWRVDMIEDGQPCTAWVPVVISAAGRFANPFSATIPGIEDYRGEVIHAHDYRSPESFTGKQVMVIGNGPSGMDIAVEIGQHNTKDHPALLSMRTGLTLKPRYPFGLPKHAWMMLNQRLPKTIGGWIDRKVEAIYFKNQERAGIKRPPPGLESGAASTRGPELLHAAQAGQVVCVAGPKRFHEDSVELDDGSVLRPDTVILATGYRPVVRYLCDLQYETGDQDWPLRAQGQDYSFDLDTLEYKGTYAVSAAMDAEKGVLERELKGYPGLYLVGIFYKGRGTLYNINVEAEIAVAQIKQRLANLKAIYD